MGSSGVRTAFALLATLALSVGFVATADAAKPDSTGKPDKGDPAPAGVYVALGDSYAAGNGAGSYLDSTCHRSLKGYPGLVAESGSLELDLQACSGATIADVLNHQLGTLDGDTDYVTITAGGNDVGFADIISTCAIGTTNDCLAEIDAAVSMIPTVQDRLTTLVGQVQTAAPNASIVVTTYPRFFDGDVCSTLLTSFTGTETAALDDGANQLAAGIMDAVGAISSENVSAVDVRGPFSGHGVCDSDEWIHDIAIFGGNSFEWFHPNAAGYQYGYTPSVGEALAVPEPNQPTKPGKGNNKKTTVTVGGVTSSDTERGTVKVKAD